MNAQNIDQIFVIVVGFGFTGLIAVIAFFLKRLVATQDEQGKAILELAKKLVEHDVKLEALQVRR